MKKMRLNIFRCIFEEFMWRILICVLALAPIVGQAQSTKSDIRGFVYDGDNGDRSVAAVVTAVKDKSDGTVVRSILSDNDGYYALTGLTPGDYWVRVSHPGFDTLYEKVKVLIGLNTKKDFYLQHISTMEAVEISVKGKARDAQVGVTNIEARAIYKMPAVGAEPDILQYLQILPGVVFSGDQGGQLYIRGGSPIMNKVMMDGLTIYNPFHSIGLFSVFETDLIQTADVYSAGFGSEYGGRVSAVVDIKTRDGNRKRMAGKVGLTTFTSKLLLESPLRKYQQGKNNSSIAISYKNSFLRESSRLLYNYANPDKLPYNFGDLFVKMSFNSANGGYTKLYGFRFSDNVAFPGSTRYGWTSTGLGGKFLVVPEQAKTRVDGYFLWSQYSIEQKEQDAKPRSSSIGGFNLGMNFSYNFKRDDFKWGIELNGFQTNFQLYNSNDRKINQLESTTEINTFGNYRVVRKRLICNIGLRNQYYASLGNGSLEPRFQLRYMPWKSIGIKFAVGMYSQNLMSAMSDRDVVNLFYGFLSGPDNLPDSFNGKPVNTRLQKARHAVAGFDYRINKKQTVNIESFVKIFDQITNINRDKLFSDDEFNLDKPQRLRQDFIIENGNAYGGDVSYKYSDKHWYLWAVYSLTYVNRFDGISRYQPNFDRRHNANILLNYEFDKKHPSEVSLRWNFGSGFPFTQTQGYYEKYNFQQGIGTDYTASNGQLGIVYAQINRGRLPYYHRLDFSVKRKWVFREGSEFNLLFSVTNVYNRNNIFYYDRIKGKRVDQLPILPALGCNYSF
ncbi:MAG: TonB-dependent receptor [Flavobacteriaceae bacterium]|nr:TonB-dependent receptor [Flavobacteriaceae bacterium]PHX78056.1 MAG: TonB-dependent receptor [Flavobacteriales bacterium]